MLTRSVADRGRCSLAPWERRPRQGSGEQGMLIQNTPNTELAADSAHALTQSSDGVRRRRGATIVARTSSSAAAAAAAAADAAATAVA